MLLLKHKQTNCMSGEKSTAVAASGREQCNRTPHCTEPQTANGVRLGWTNNSQYTNTMVTCYRNYQMILLEKWLRLLKISMFLTLLLGLRLPLLSKILGGVRGREGSRCSQQQMLISSSAAAQDGIKVIIKTNLPVVANRKQFSCSLQQIFQKAHRQRWAFCITLRNSMVFKQKRVFSLFSFHCFTALLESDTGRNRTTDSLEKPKRGKIDSLRDLGKNQVLNFISCFRTKHYWGW